MNAWVTWSVSPLAVAVIVAAALSGVIAAVRYTRVGAGGPAVFRGVAMSMLALMALRPTLSYVEPPTSARPLRLVVDDSLSMNVADPRTPGENLELAAALDNFDDAAWPRPVFDAERVRNTLASVRVAADAVERERERDPVAATQRAALNVLRERVLKQLAGLADSAKRAGCDAQTIEAIHSAEDAVSNGADTATALAALDEIGPDLRRRGNEAAEREAAGHADVAKRLAGFTRFEMARRSARRLMSQVPGSGATGLDGRAIDLTADLKPAAIASPITAALRDACARTAAEKGEAVVLLSDGRSTESRSLLATAAAMRVPIYPVVVAPDLKSPDVRVLRVDVRSAALAGQPLLVRVKIAQRNAGGRDARVVVTDGTREVVRTINLGNDNTYDFVWPNAVAPRTTLTARVDPLAGETRLQNNSGTVTVPVYDKRVRVLVLSNALDRDTVAAGDALTAVPWAQVRRFVTEPGRLSTVSVADIDSADMLILSDVSGEALDENSWAAIERAVRRGAAMAVLAGAGDWLADPTVAQRLGPLLPVTPGPRPVWSAPPARVWPVPTRFGVDTPYLRPDESAEASLRVWLGRPKLGRVLSVGPPSPTARVLLMDRTTQAPVILEGAAGAGRVVMVLTDEAWRWNTPDAPDTAADFWCDMAQHVIDLPYDAVRGALSLSPASEVVPVGRPVVVRARTADPAGPAVTLSVRRGGVVVGTPALREILPGGGRWTAVLDLQPGEYELVLQQGDSDVTVPLTVRADAEAELADTSPDAGLLQRAADATGGAVLSVDHLDTLPDLLGRRRERRERIGTYDVWSSPYWFSVIVACLGMEWALRPRAGMA